MADLPEFRVYLSSTVDDLQAERAAARDIVSKFGPVQDTYRADEKASTVANCLADVHKAQCYVGIIGHRYGWVPDDDAPTPGDPKSKSITELEYESCFTRTKGGPVPRLLFLRTLSDDKYRDSENRTATAARIKEFRDRVRKDRGAQALEFSSLADLKVALNDALGAAQRAYHSRVISQRSKMELSRVWSGALKPVALLSAWGSDDTLAQRLCKLRPGLFSRHGIQVDAPDAAVQAEAAIAMGKAKDQQAAGQVVAVVLSKSSLAYLQDPLRKPHFERLLATLKRRGDIGALLLDDLDLAALPADWQQTPNVKLEAAAMAAQAEVAVDAWYDKLQTALGRTLTTQARLGLGCLVLAPTDKQVASLLKPAGFAAFDDDMRAVRQAQFQRLFIAARPTQAQWPKGCYGPAPQDWCNFGAQGPTVAETVDTVVGHINNAQRGTRERSQLQDARILLHHYALDEYLTDRNGSRAAVEGMLARGALVVVDEVALLHPALRSAALKLLAAPRSAVVLLSACDPALQATGKLLAEGSHLNVAPLVTRFGAEFDPQCELALNSDARLQRWLRLAIPRLLVETDGGGALPLNDADALFAGQAPPAAQATP